MIAAVTQTCSEMPSRSRHLSVYQIAALLPKFLSTVVDCIPVMVCGLLWRKALLICLAKSVTWTGSNAIMVTWTTDVGDNNVKYLACLHNKVHIDSMMNYCLLGFDIKIMIFFFKLKHKNV